MKRTLALLAAGFMVAAPLSMAMAADAAPAAAPAVEAPASADAAAVAAYEVTLENGTKVSIEGDKAFVVGADGAKTAAPDGDHVLADGSKMTVSAGMITAGKPAAPAAAPAEGEATPE